jgi:Protein of unknown function (DUF2796)
MRSLLAVVVATAFGAAVQAEEQERRELGAHEHGHAKLNLAVEGSQVVMEVEAPGLDVLGFEHPAASAEEKAAVERGKAALSEPLGLFVPPAAAGCRVTESAVELLQEEEHEGEGHAAGEAGGEELHNEFRGRYTLECDAPGALTSVAFAWFDRFPNAKEVEVTLVTAQGQTSYEVERGDPPLTIEATS